MLLSAGPGCLDVAANDRGNFQEKDKWKTTNEVNETKMNTIRSLTILAPGKLKVEKHV